jgi:IPT/TIG domain
MATLSASALIFGKTPRPLAVSCTKRARPGQNFSKCWALLAGIVVLSSLAIAQGTPQVTAVDPATGKVNDTVTVSGSDLGKTSVSSVYLSDDKNDYKATIVDQSNEKITMKVPQVKPGDYNVSIQVGDKLFIKPVKFKVEQ